MSIQRQHRELPEETVEDIEESRDALESLAENGEGACQEFSRIILDAAEAQS